MSHRHLNKGQDYFVKGCYPKALLMLQRAHERFALADNLAAMAETLNSMANVYYRMGDYSSASMSYDDAIGLFRQLGDSQGVVRALANKSAALSAARQLDEAAITLDAMDRAAADSPVLAALRLKCRALYYMARKNPAEAHRCLDQALKTVSPSDTALMADLHYTKGDLLRLDGKPGPAAAHFETALDIDHRAGAYYSIGMDLAALGFCSGDLAQHGRAVDYFERSIKIFALLGASSKVQWVLDGLKRNAEKAGVDIQNTLRWAGKWLAGEQEAYVCR